MKFELPKRVVLIILAAVVIAVLLYILGVPSFAIALVGIGIWVILLIAQGGHVEGNPYKRMGYSSLPDFVEVSQYRKRQKEELQDRASPEVTIFMFLLGLIFFLIGLLAFLFPWNIWSVFR
ncbi:MAG: hypothetical protein ACE5QW_08035 [Thermoplasmata archaeon]